MCFTFILSVTGLHGISFLRQGHIILWLINIPIAHNVIILLSLCNSYLERATTVQLCNDVNVIFMYKTESRGHLKIIEKADCSAESPTRHSSSRQINNVFLIPISFRVIAKSSRGTRRFLFSISLDLVFDHNLTLFNSNSSPTKSR